MNCSNRYPLTEQLYKELATNHNTEVIVFTTIAGVVCVVMLILYIEAVCFVFKRYSNHRQKIRIMFLLGLCPVVAWTSCLAILVPKCTLLSQFVASIYLSFCIVIFRNLLIDFFGGTNTLLQEMSGQTLAFGTPPCCCCCICCNKFPFDKKHFRIASACALQVAIIRPIVLFVGAVLWTDERYNPGQEGQPSSLGFVVSTFSSASTLFGLWGMLIIYRSTKERLPMFLVGMKFTSLQLVLLVVNVQSFIISILAQNDIPSCEGTRGSLFRGSRLHNYILIFEMFLISIVSRFAYRRKEAKNLHHYNTETYTEADSNDNEAVHDATNI